MSSLLWLSASEIDDMQCRKDANYQKDKNDQGLNGVEFVE